MGFFKILGGVAIGVGAVAAAPFTGGGSIVGAIGLAGSLAGAGTVAAAVGAGAVGAAVGASMDGSKDNDKKNREIERNVTAKYEKKVEKLVTCLGEAEKKLSDDKSYFQLLVALFAIGMATANADGEISEEELIDLEEFTAGIGHSKLPPHIKGMFTRMKNNPPNFNTAMMHVSKLETIDIELFESVIEVISASDGKVSEEEKALLTTFRELAA